jgi:hypothetical protein
MDLEFGFIRARVAASNLCPSSKVLARRSQPPSEMNVFRSCGRKVERLRSFACAAIGPLNAIDDGIGAINSDQAIEIYCNRASSMPIIR